MFAWLDCGSGISGDKFLSSLIDAGLDVDVLRRRLDTLGLTGWELRVRQARSGGLSGTKLDVDVTSPQPARTWSSIRAMLDAADLPEPVRATALRAFGILAEAEASAHGVSVEDVHFHEVGAVDSIVDIVGAAIGIHELGIDEVWASPVRLGFGSVSTAHGELPVPAPATAALIVGVSVFAGEIPGELTTPTGAALLRTLVTRYAPLPPLTVRANGRGVGTYELPIANVLDIVLGERTPVAPGTTMEEIAVLESVVDTATAEHIGSAIDLLLEAGALDAWSTPVSMKKGRTGAEMTVVARIADAPAMTELLMRHTGTTGVRTTPTWRMTADRRVETVSTTLGDVRVKLQGEGTSLRVRPENDDVARIARETGMPLDRIVRMLTEQAEQALGIEGDPES